MPRRRELVDANIVPAVQLWSGLEKTGLRTASTVSVGFACRCAAASTVSIGLLIYLLTYKSTNAHGTSTDLI